ncbi:hypothetical protein [Brevundimonas sp.]|uniref:hypothetical protein n=1 Tax=Brevundimonas sp. TaxID=1871086 RepID=UPI0035B0BCF2
MNLALILAVAALQASPSASPTFICEGAQRFACDDVNGCIDSPLPITTWAEFDFSGNAYRRCDRTSCDDYTPVVTRSGEFLNIELPGRASFAKIGPDASFTEVITLGTQVMITYGRCRPTRD